MNNNHYAGIADLVSLSMIVETLTFAAETPVTIEQICGIYEEVVGTDAPVTREAIEETLERLNDSYEKEGHAFRIQYWAGGLRMATTPSLAPFLEAFFRRERSRRLTKPLMETLAIIAYRQPSTRAEIDAIRGVDSGYAIRKLLSLDLISITGRADVVGRPMLYATTDRFLEQFGLKDLDGLPDLKQAEELLEDVNFDEERLALLTTAELLPQLDESQETESEDSIEDPLPDSPAE